MDEAVGARVPPLAVAALFASTFVIATCGLVYELVAGAIGSYLLGDSVTQFSLVIGLYLSAMGLGSYLSKFIAGDLVVRFLRVEVAVGLVGGLSAVAVLLAHSHLGSVRPVLFGSVIVVGALVGLEIPILMRVLKDQVAFADLVARVLAFDYLGALAASLLFPLLCVPTLGLPRTALLFGLLNSVVALVLTQVFRERLGPRRRTSLALEASLVTALLAAAFVGVDRLEALTERALYDAPVLFKKKSPYQTVVITRWRDDLRLWLDGHLQFSSQDERRYHESLVHPAVAAAGAPPVSALVLGGGDGLALRELLRYPSLERVTLVDLDPVMLEVFSGDAALRALNADAYRDPRVTVVNQDAMRWLDETQGAFDVVVIDLPDPRNYSLGKLYSYEFYRLVRRRVAEGGAVVVQATSPYHAPRAFWCVERTLADAGFATLPYHAHVPSFGDWGFVLALPLPPDGGAARPAPTRVRDEVQGKLTFLDDATLRSLFVFPPDMRRPEGIEVNRLSDQALVKYHEADWGRLE
jgi:spermidine synthase